MLQSPDPAEAWAFANDGRPGLCQTVWLATVEFAGTCHRLLAVNLARRIELGCWVVALALAALLAAGTTSTAAGAAGLPSSSVASVGQPASSAVLGLWDPTASTGYCIKEVIGLVRRWPSSRDLQDAINRECFSPRQHQALVAVRRTSRAVCARPFGWRPTMLPGRETGCLVY